METGLIRDIRELERYWGFEPMNLQTWTGAEIWTYYTWLASEV